MNRDVARWVWAALVALASGCYDPYDLDPLILAQADSSAAGYSVGASGPAGAPVETSTAPRTSVAPAVAPRGRRASKAIAGAATAIPERPVAPEDSADPRPRGPDVVTLPMMPGATDEDSIIVHPFLAFSPVARTAWIDVIAGLDGANGALNFNGGFEGAHTVIVPIGWRVEGRFINGDRDLAHSMIVVREIDPIPVLAPPAAFPGAFSVSLEEGIAEGRTDIIRFVADTEGRYLFLCAVPGHGQAGMWLRLVVSKTAAQPEYRR